MLNNLAMLGNSFQQCLNPFLGVEILDFPALTSDCYDKNPREGVMDIERAQSEMRYRLTKMILAAMLEDGIITESEFEVIRIKLIKKLKPLIGGLE